MASNSGLKTSVRFDKQVHVASHASSRNSGAQTLNSVRSRASVSKRSVTPNSRTYQSKEDDEDHGRVRVAVRLRPRNAEDLLSDADFADCVELQPELKRLKLRKNNWSTESYRFDEVFTNTASQKRVYEVVAKPVVESVLNGYNGTVMAYGQTGTGKTYTVGRLGKDDASERGIMVRALEDIFSITSPTSDCVEVSFVQLYMESIQDLFAPENVNIPISEDPRTGEVSVPGASIVKVRDLEHFLQLLQMGEANRHAANTKMNTESSRSHAILMVYLRRSVHEKMEQEATPQEKDSRTDLHSGNGIPVVRKSKLLIVDLAGSERLDKSGSEGHSLEEAKFINLSLTSLGKCINALAENSPHIPIRDSKLTRLLRDSFGGSARTSLIITIGPSARHHAETAGTIMFGQRAMKIVNMMRLKEEFDYESLCRKLENQVDHLTAEVERQQMLRDKEKCELEKQLKECQYSFSESEKNLLTRSELLQKENTRLELEIKEILNELNLQKNHNDLMHDKVGGLEMSLQRNKLLQKENTRLELEIKEISNELSLQKNHNDLMHDKIGDLEMSLQRHKQQQHETSVYQNVLADTTQMYERKLAELMKQLEDERTRSEHSEEELDKMKKLLSDHKKSFEKQLQMENSSHQKALADSTQIYEKKLAELNKQLESEHVHFEGAVEQLDLAKKLLSDHENPTQIQVQREIDVLRGNLQEMYQLHDNTTNELQCLKSEYKTLLSEKVKLNEELHAVRQRLLVEEKKRKTIENELVKLKNVPESETIFEDKKTYLKEHLGTPVNLSKSNPLKDRAVISKICEEVGLQKILQLLTSRDVDVQIHAVKVIANLAAEDINQEKIVEEGGLDSLLMLLQSSENTTILRVASGAVANLAMNAMNQGLIMSKGGARLLADTSTKTNDPQTLRMVAGALSNLCGNESIQTMLKEDGGIKALLGMVRSGSNDVIAQVARGMANFAKCESRGIIRGHRKGRSLIIEDGALKWLISSSKTVSTSTQRHIELALCHLAQNEDNARDFISSGGLKELKRISLESSMEDICNLAKKILKSSPIFRAEMHAEWQ